MKAVSRRIALAGLAFAASHGPAEAQQAGQRSPAAKPMPLPTPPAPRFLAPEERGETLRVLCDRLAPLLEMEAKGRFESDAQHEARVTAEAAKLGVPVGRGNTARVRFSAARLSCSYDATSEEVRIGAAARRAFGPEDMNIGPTQGNKVLGATMFMDQANQPLLPYFHQDFLAEVTEMVVTGRERRQNAFGAGAEVTVIGGTGAGLAYCARCVGPAGANAFKMARTVAQTEYDSMEVVVEGSIVPPVLRKGAIYNKPELADPRDLVIDVRVLMMTTNAFMFISGKSGEVFHRIAFTPRAQ